MFQTKDVEKIKKRILCSVTFYPPNRAVYEMKVKSKGIPRQAEVALGVPGNLRTLIFSTFGTTRVVGCQPKAPTAFTQEKSLVLIFRG